MKNSHFKEVEKMTAKDKYTDRRKNMQTEKLTQEL